MAYIRHQVPGVLACLRSREWPERSIRPHRRTSHLPTTPRHREGPCLHQPGRRDRYRECLRALEALRSTARYVITQEPFLLIKGRLQNVDNVISVYSFRVEALRFDAAIGAHSHDFH